MFRSVASQSHRSSHSTVEDPDDQLIWERQHAAELGVKRSTGRPKRPVEMAISCLFIC